MMGSPHRSSRGTGPLEHPDESEMINSDLATTFFFDVDSTCRCEKPVSVSVSQNIWRCPEIGYPPIHPFWIGIFHYKPSILGHSMNGNPHIGVPWFVQGTSQNPVVPIPVRPQWPRYTAECPVEGNLVGNHWFLGLAVSGTNRQETMGC